MRAKGFLVSLNRAVEAFQEDELTAEQLVRRLEWLYDQLHPNDHARVGEDYEYAASYARMERSKERFPNRRRT